MFVFRSDHSRSRWVTIMPSSMPLKSHVQMGGGKENVTLKTSGVLAEHKVLRMGMSQQRTQYTGEDGITPHCVLVNVVRMTCRNFLWSFWNIPIVGVVGVIFLESPNMGRIPQTLKLSHPV